MKGQVETLIMICAALQGQVQAILFGQEGHGTRWAFEDVNAGTLEREPYDSDRWAEWVEEVEPDHMETDHMETDPLSLPPNRIETAKDRCESPRKKTTGRKTRQQT